MKTIKKIKHVVFFVAVMCRTGVPYTAEDIIREWENA